jgi:DNA-binding transcriptional LysR family regulator
VIGHEILPPILAALKRKHTALAIELSLSNKNEDILRRDADIAIRMQRPTQGALVARLVGRIEIGLFAHSDWIKAHGTPKTIQSLLKQNCLIGYDKNTTMLSAFGAQGLKVDRNSFAFRSDNDLAQLAALRAGFGPGMCQVQLASRDLKRILTRVKHSLEMWLVTHADLRNDASIRTVMDILGEQLTHYVRRKPSS